MLARFEDAGVEFTLSSWAVAYADNVARCSGGDSNHAAHEWAAHGLSDICHDVKSALGVGVHIRTDPSPYLTAYHGAVHTAVPSSEQLIQSCSEALPQAARSEQKACGEGR
eukprot:jgi/Tetstr1/453709/TSEL_040665.t1